MRWMVYGAGAVGGVLGGLLHEAGHDVVLVARGPHLDALRRDGLTAGGPGGHPHGRRTRRGGRPRGPRRRGRTGHRAAGRQEPPDARRRRGPHLGAARRRPRSCRCRTAWPTSRPAAVLRRRPGRLRDDADRPPRARRRRAALGAGPGHPRRRPLPGRHRRHQPRAWPRPSGTPGSSPSRAPTSWPGSTAS